MTKRHNCKFKASRRLGVNLWGRAKDPFNTKNYPPGSHGPMGYKKATEYGLQASEKQKLKKYYGDIKEKQFFSLYKKAVKKKGDTGENFIGLLESRLASIVYRAKFAPTVFAARQLVNHGHILVNGKKVNISSYKLAPNDVIEVKLKSHQIPLILEAIESNERSMPDYLQHDGKKTTSVTYKRVPALADVPYPVKMEPHLIIEFYSR